MSRALADALEKLLATRGSAAASLFTSSQRRELDMFIRQTGTIRRLTKGQGSIYEVDKPALVRSHLDVLRPVAETALDPMLPQRASNIARMRDSKASGHRHQTSYLLMKAISPNVRWDRGDGVILDLTTSTEIGGVSALSVRSGDGWTTNSPVWLVENQALFDRLDWLPADSTGSIVYYGGQLSKLLLTWLGDQSRTEKILFFPDYDGVGLLNYARLVEHSASPVQFWLMPRWKPLLERFGSNTVWTNTRQDFLNAVQRLEKFDVFEELRELCQTLAALGLALEHEAVWLSSQKTACRLTGRSRTFHR